MSTEQPQPVTPPSTVDGAWGAPATPADTVAPKSTRPGRKLAIGIAVAIGIAGAGAGVVYAASDSTSSSADQGQGPGGGGMGGGPGGGTSGGPGVLSQALHGEYVVSDGNGGYATELLQNGEVTEVSDTSITAESEDGYSRTYTIDSAAADDLSDIETGDDVTIVATASGDTATVESVMEEGAGQAGQAPPDQGDGTSQGN